MFGQYTAHAIPATISTGGTESDAIDVRGANKIAFEVPTFAVGCETANANVKCKVCDSPTGTFRHVADMGVYSATSGIYDWEVPTGAGNQTILCRPAVGFNYVKIALAVNTASANVTCVVHEMH